MLTKNEVIDLIEHNKTSYYQIVKYRYKELFAYVKTLNGQSLAEQLYNYCYPGDYKCLTCGTDKVKFQEFTTGYKKYCSPGCVSRSDKVKQGQQAFISDPLRVKARIKKAEETSLKKYGTRYYAQTTDGKLRISESNTKFNRTKLISVFLFKKILFIELIC
jgi:hypothetical protein